MRAKKILLFVLVCAISFAIAQAQSPAPVIVPAATAAVSTAKTQPVPDSSDSLQGAIKLLEEMKASNEATLKKQDETLQRLDELQKTANQLKIYAQRS